VFSVSERLRVEIVINCNDKKAVPTSPSFLCDVEADPAKDASPSENQTPQLKDVSKGAAWRSLCSPAAKTPHLQYDLDQAKARLRHTIEVSLQPNYAIPEVADILTDFLLDVVQEDPQTGTLFRAAD